MNSQRARRVVLAVALVAGVMGVSGTTAVAVAGPPLPVTAVVASGDDGNVAANTLDDNLSIRWSTDLQNYDFPDASSRYLRVVGHGNTANNWTSITETTVNGAASAPGDQSQAAVRYGWGTPLPISDEFDYTGPVDPAKWDVPTGDEGGTPGCWEGHSGNGRRCAKNSTVADGIMTMRGEASGDTGWLEQKLDRRYGRWEIRSRSRNIGTSGGLYHALHLIWPTSGKRLEDGEYDWVEYSNPDAQCLQAFLHYPQSPSDKKVRRELCPVDMTQWHNFAFEWTAAGLVGYVDGVEWFRLSGGAGSDRGNIQDMPSGHLNIQLDNFTGNSGLRPAVFEVDWVRTYA